MIFVLNIFKGIVHLRKLRKCNHAGNKEFLCLQFFPFVKPGRKNGEVFASDGYYVSLYGFLSTGFFIG